MVCPRCRTENPPQAKFCLECVTPLARRCTSCGTPLPPSAKFCLECAHPVGGVPGGPARAPESYIPRHLAEKILTSRTTWEEPDTVANLCCGLAGRAYGLLNLYRASGDREWFDRARELAERAAIHIERSGIAGSLYKGDVGAAVLAAEVSDPEAACMPLFEPERWPR